MEIGSAGIPIYHTRVERWECDYNDHWNTRFYGRGFQAASDAAAARAPGGLMQQTEFRGLHVRFHRELLVSAPVEVRSAVVDGGEFDGAVVHLMLSDEKLAATALDWTGRGAGQLPRHSSGDLEPALPRGISPEPAPEPDLSEKSWLAVELGPIESGDLDRSGRLLMERVMRHGSIGEHTRLNKLGFTPDFSASTGITRMAVEYRGTLVAPGQPGALLRGYSRVSSIEEKRFRSLHWLVSDNNRILATIELCVLTVDLASRRAAPVPDILRRTL